MSTVMFVVAKNCAELTSVESYLLERGDLPTFKNRTVDN